VTERFSRNVNVRTNDNTNSNIFGFNNANENARGSDYTVKHYADSKTELASKKTASSICLGSDKPDTVKSAHLNRNDELKAAKLHEADTFTPKWIADKKDATALKNNFIYGTD